MCYKFTILWCKAPINVLSYVWWSDKYSIRSLYSFLWTIFHQFTESFSDQVSVPLLELLTLLIAQLLLKHKYELAVRLWIVRGLQLQNPHMKYCCERKSSVNDFLAFCKGILRWESGFRLYWSCLGEQHQCAWLRKSSSSCCGWGQKGLCSDSPRIWVVTILARAIYFLISAPG